MVNVAIRPILLCATLLLASLSLPLTTPAAASDAEGWTKAIHVFPASADQTTALTAAEVPTTNGWIGPGAHLLITMDSQPGLIFGCTANFLWTSSTKTYLGAAGHCFIPPSAVSTHGTGANYNPSGTHVRVCIGGCEFGGQTGFILTGTTAALGPVAYARQTASDGDIGNDFGIVEVPSSLASRENPAMPVWGGPTAATGVIAGNICFYGNAAGLGETIATKARMGRITSVSTKAWYAAAPSFEGDSGSAVVTCGVAADSGVHGVVAAGILTHLALGSVGTTAGTTVPRAKAMATEASLTIDVVTVPA